MNIKRGLVRMWLVLSVIWIVAAIFISWESIKLDEWWSDDPNVYADLPVPCDKARGTEGRDYSQRPAPEPWNAVRNPGSACWYGEDKFRILFSFYDGDSHGKVSKMLYGELGWEPAEGNDKFLRTKPVVMTALIPPLLAYAVGTAFVWAFSGFARPKQS
ncbi:hypothetical protein [Rhizobium ruizarguesonis]|uniref:hypothetical protein n=1 Tax=Rhizobium ruizarguesonis TaxID=2081791 RepID=UPI0013C24795|nr:hypothetical protein [Rhizobium ruizarguesonis]NEH32651.1 hypothetical protein [Rhizobium ruizarguesonis]NEK07471.1 hypothetical protein [Rhizobium ruizarguesonis]